MSSNPTTDAVAEPPGQAQSQKGHEQGQEDQSGYITKPAQLANARSIVRLFQCQVCSHPLKSPVILPCGQSICKDCLPETHIRANITYPEGLDRCRRFLCPVLGCDREHVVDDCAADVILNKATQHVKDSIECGKNEAIKLQVTTSISIQDEWALAGVPSLRHDETNHHEVLSGGKLLATWSLAETGRLKIEADVSYISTTNSTHSTISTQTLQDDFAPFESDALDNIQVVARSEMDCQICYGLFLDPLTTSCGHTFCRACLHRILDHSTYCPICRRKLGMSPLLNHASCPSNERLASMIKIFWLDELRSRQKAINAERFGGDGLDTPLFSCTLAFPTMPTLLHIFEPRYRLMIRRCMEGNRTFGMVLPKQPRDDTDFPFYEVGTLVRIVNVHYYRDGRSLIETTGVSRFKVIEHDIMDGYIIGKTQRIDDISLEEEETIEAREATPNTTPNNDESSTAFLDTSSYSNREQQPPDVDVDVDAAVLHIDTMSTQGLKDFALDFINRMKDQNAPWLIQHMPLAFGDIPSDPATLPWWLASVLPVSNAEKYRLLSTLSVRSRMKVCCQWISEWEERSW